jgi:hypothetical protein
METEGQETHINVNECRKRGESDKKDVKSPVSFTFVMVMSCSEAEGNEKGDRQRRMVGEAILVLHNQTEYPQLEKNELYSR